MYSLIAYKPSSEDYCRGCRMASYRSQFQSFTGLNEFDIAREWAKIICFNATQLDYNEAGFDVLLFDDGIKIWDENECGGPTFYGSGYIEDETGLRGQYGGHRE